MTTYFLMREKASSAELSELIARLTAQSFESDVVRVGERQLLRLDANPPVPKRLPSSPAVERIFEASHFPRLVDRLIQPENTVVKVGPSTIGDDQFAVVAGPCAVESREQILATALAVKEAGATILRGDAFKPRTSPYAFQGLGVEALEYLAEAREETGLPFVAEVVDPRDVARVAEQADMIRIGTRNMANYALLKEVGQQHRPVMLKRGRTARVEEWLDAAEYICQAGNPDVVLVERGIRTFEDSSRNTLDITAVPVVKALSHLPIMVDPSHAAGRRELVAPLARAAMAVGAHGVLVDVHPDPPRALVDGDQALRVAEFEELMSTLRSLAGAVQVEL